MGKYEKCDMCKNDNTYHNYCKPCQAKIFKEKFSDWSSGNGDIDEIIKSAQHNADLYSISTFEIIKKIEGDFHCVYEATRMDGGLFLRWNLKTKVAERNEHYKSITLKSFNTLSNFLTEVCLFMI